jgi:large repetitive protein
MTVKQQISVDNRYQGQIRSLFSLPNNIGSKASDSANMPDLLPSSGRITIVNIKTSWNSTNAGFCRGELQTLEANKMKPVNSGTTGSNRGVGLISKLGMALVFSLLSLFAVSAANAGNLSNTARATGNPPTGAAINSTTSTIAIPVVTKNPAYTVVKSISSQTTSNGANASQVDGGDIITYSYVVANTGNVSINTVVVTDPGVSFNGGAANALTSGPTKVSGDTTNPNILDVGETWTYTASYTLTQANVNAAAGVTNGVSNTVSVTAKDPQAVTVNPTAGGSTLTATETIAASPSLTIAKTANTAGPLTVGQVVTYSFLVTNNGNVTITGVAIQETAFNGTGGTGAITPTGGASTLAPGATTTFTANYTVTQADIDGLQP